MKKTHLPISLLLCISAFSFSMGSACADEVEDLLVEETLVPNVIMHDVNFNDVPITEFIRYVSKVSEENFIFNNKELEFHITFSSGKPISPQSIVKALVRLLRMHNFHVTKEENSYVIYKPKKKKVDVEADEGFSDENLLASSSDHFLSPIKVKKNFHVYKLQYHEGAEILDSLKKMAVDLSSTSSNPDDLLQAVQALQWVKATNSLLFSGRPETIGEMQKIISSLDVPLRQVFIEVLVIETDVKKSMDFGLQWAAGGQINGKVGFGTGSFAPNQSAPQGGFPSIMQGINATNTPTGLAQVPIVPGFDLGVIGDIILHKGKSYLSLGSLVSALQVDGDSTIVLNQKIITQDNKHSKIFVGDNIPFTGSVVQTIGQGQQTTANIEYRDVGVSLNITPMLGEDDVISLNLDEEITEAVEEHGFSAQNNVGGIRTTKTNMLTHVHVPDKHFLVLSGMIRNAKSTYKAGIPFLGSIPFIGALFSKTKKLDEKRNIIIFVRPQIIHSFKDYEKITTLQEDTYEKRSNAADFSEALDTLPPAP